MRYFFILLTLFAFLGCETQKKISADEIAAYEQQMKEKLKAAKIELGKMRFDVENLSDSLKTDLNQKIDNFDQKLDVAEKKYNDFKEINDREMWKSGKMEVDSMLSYLKVQIDTTRTNIRQLIEDV
ncbi:MAG: hypothetical protein H6627_06365 [Calditrichae bacterium]|nr:hypothetical protein [Calditrichota bacterium]MCB9058173.1 hypothetical protein [Calditrichia bacterium]